MVAAVEYQSQVLNGINKSGTLKKNADGSYDFIVGALNMINGKNEYYEYDYAKKFFDASADLVRMAKKKILRGEYGHPKQQVGQSEDDFITRLLMVEEKSVACFHQDIRLDHDNFRDVNGKPFIGIVSKLRPDGPYGDVLEKQINTKEMDVCFSIRCFSQPHRIGGRVIREMKHVVTFDYVTEPGIAYATKYNCPSLESRDNKVFTRGTIERAARNMYNAPGTLESSRSSMKTLLDVLGLEVRDTPQAKRNFLELMNTPRL